MRFPRSNRLNLLKDIWDVDYENLKILDYGGNHGNLVKDGLNEKNYTCLDCYAPVLEEAKEEHPDATWVHYDRKNQVYNPAGKEFIPFPFEDKSFDIVFSYSLHTHCSYEDFLFDISEMKRVSRRFATSILDKSVFDFLKMKRQMDYNEVHELWDDPDSTETYRYYINADTVTTDSSEIPEQCDFLLSYYNKDWLKSEHPDIEITEAFSPYNQPFVIWTE